MCSETIHEWIVNDEESRPYSGQLCRCRSEVYATDIRRLLEVPLYRASRKETWTVFLLAVLFLACWLGAMAWLFHHLRWIP